MDHGGPTGPEPHLSTLDLGDVSVVLQLHPVGLKQLGSDQEVQVHDLVVLSDQRGGETQLTVALDDGQYPPEHLGCGEARCIVNVSANIFIMLISQY